MRPRRTGTAPRSAVATVCRRPGALLRGPAGLLVVGEGASPRVTVRRLPPGGWGGPGEIVDEHVNARLAPGSPWSDRADVLMLDCAHRPALAARAADGVLARFPGCLVAVACTADGGCVAAARGGARVRVTPAAGERPATAEELAVAASCLHAELVLGGSWTDLRAICLAVPAGPRAPGRGRVRFRPDPVPPAGAWPGGRLPA
ncbi:hypothetical protein RVR_2666 [Actinacidiphila reveromycinica]|uniref:Uncharacterized protein n=1 Tax=Actinacidiphila reveromycinica TaxID=659352 RepID=A0A7U3VMZ9_9ACTN|nr:hypothetical protein [Streptomyces sp. SN-593]BBA97089.1 hypothetical protein RVR_2666 [Streptomyces sp. SN-593]